ncbi:anti-sigma factor family protein [Novosphingobium bradum]|uniref:Anti-sigma factor family protein n=1 Tax=Novosphingobium bradum TaxID=1737444 RepID=A0ABV7IS51_9SPHN
MSTDDRTPRRGLPGARLPDDERISAWLDGQLDEEGNAEMADLAARNEELAARAARLRGMDSLVRAAVPAEDEAIPAELLARLGLAPAAPVGEAGAEPAGLASAAEGAAEVIDLASVRAARAARAPARSAPRLAGLGRIAAQLLLVFGLGLGIVLAVGQHRETAGPDAAASYRVLGDDAAAPAAANALVRFAPGIDALEAQVLARRAGAVLVGPPSAAGTARAAIDPARRDAVLARLRAAPGVVLAEPLDSGAPQ